MPDGAVARDRRVLATETGRRWAGVLREVGKPRPRLVPDRLLPRAGRALGVTVREAVKYPPRSPRHQNRAGHGLGRYLIVIPPDPVRKVTVGPPPRAVPYRRS